MINNCTLCNGAGVITPLFSATSAKCPRCNGLSFKEVDEKDTGFDPQKVKYICFVSASATPAAPLERENLWTAVQAGLYDHPRDTSVAVADRVTSALENSKPAVLCVGNVLYYREDKALKEAKELRERAATLISSLRSVVDECEQRLRPKKDDRVDLNVRVGIHSGCGGNVIADADFIPGEEGDEIWWNYRCIKCNDTFQYVREFQEPKRKKAVKKAVVNKRKKAVKKGKKPL